MDRRRLGVALDHPNPRDRPEMAPRHGPRSARERPGALTLRVSTLRVTAVKPNEDSPPGLPKWDTLPEARTSSAITPAPAPEGSWRIDDLAHRAGVAVDTIRYYQREGLLPPAERSGRTNLYGPAHLERLDRIKELQGRRFSLAAIRALLVADREALFEGFFAHRGGARYALAELFERAGLDPELGARLRDAGMLRDPAEHGRDAYDADDLDMVRAVADLLRLGLPEDVVVEMCDIYVEGLEVTERQVVGLFTTGGSLRWDPGEFADFRDFSARFAPQILPLARRMVDFLHNRTLQRLTRGALEHGVPSSGPSETA